MSISYRSGGPNANLYAQLKQVVLYRVSEIKTVEYVPDDIKATLLRGMFAPVRLDSSIGPDLPKRSKGVYTPKPVNEE